MDHASDQKEELEALDAIFPTEFQPITNKYPNIEFDIVIKPSELAGTSATAFVVPQKGDDDSDSDDSDDEPFEPTCTLRFTFGKTYPESAPGMELLDLEEEFSEEVIAACTQTLCDTAEENLGMAMVFTVVSVLQEQLTEMYAEREKQALIEKHRARDEADEVDAKKALGTPVNVENFLAWQTQFDLQDELVLKRRKKAEAAAKRPTGKAQFLADRSLGLDLADVDLTEFQDDSLAIDESLFDDLDIDDEEAND